MNDVFTNINDYNKQRKRKVLIIFDDTIADIMNNKNFKAIVKELFIRCRKLNVSIVFITQSYFRTPKNARLNSTHYIIMKIQNKKQLQSIAQENCGDIDLKDFLNIYQKFTNDLYLSKTIDTTLPSGRSMRFRKKLLSMCFIKMTKLDQIKILDNKIRSNEAHLSSTEKTLKYQPNQAVN